MAGLQASDFVVGEDLDVLFDFCDDEWLDGDIEIQQQLICIGEEVTDEQPIIQCNQCTRKYKTKRGLARHCKNKHKDLEESSNQHESVLGAKIHPLELKALISRALMKLQADQCFPKLYRSHFKSFEISLDKCIELRNKFATAIDNFNGNAEKFFAICYQIIASGSIALLSPLDLQETNILLTELINFCLAKLCGFAVDKDIQETHQLNEGKAFTKREIDALEYVAGYCFKKIYLKIRNSKHWESDLSQQYLSILRAIKTDTPQTLVDLKNRGGLWKVNQKAIQVLKKAEVIFCRSSSRQNIRSINAKQIVEAIMMDPQVKSNLAFLASSSEHSVDKEVAKNLFEHVIHLFIRVRSHSLAKEIKEKHKERKISTKKRPLRTEIKQASLSKDLGH